MEIDKGVPIPPGRRKERGDYPFRKMEVNDSFLVPCEPDDEKTKSRITGRVTYENRKKYAKFCTRYSPKDEKAGVPGIRVWRTE
jgi:hypothetical protein